MVNPTNTIPDSQTANLVVGKNRRGIQSIEIGSSLLLQLAHHVRPMGLKDLAKAAHMTTGKAHPYMVSFLKVGFVIQNDVGHYELGPLALQLGFARLQRLEPVREATQFIEGLAHETGQSVALAVWGNLGPTIVRLDEPAEPMHVNLRAGTVMALKTTATGRLFAAYLPHQIIERALQADRTYPGARSGVRVDINQEAFEAALAETRQYGMSRALSQPIPGIDALCAPVFDSAGHLVLGILTMGPSATFDSDWNGKVATPLRACALAVSQRLGYRVLG